MKKLVILPLLALMALLFLPTAAHSAHLSRFRTDRLLPAPPPWALLGKRTVNFSLDHDEIAAAGQGLFTGIKIKVKGGALNMHRVVVHFANGEQQEFELRNNFAPGSESRILDLPGNKRVISRVTLWYDSKNMQGKRTLVEVWGRR